MANEMTVPLLPCGSIDVIADFYRVLGFRSTYRQLRPNPYLARSNGRTCTCTSSEFRISSPKTRTARAWSSYRTSKSFTGPSPRGCAPSTARCRSLASRE
jgi:hypothetical protein